jgi:hypothetical protein
MILEANEFAYKGDKFAKILQSHIDATIDGEFSAIGISDEGVLIAPDQPSFQTLLKTRIERLSGLFSSDTTVLLTIREQFA